MINTGGDRWIPSTGFAYISNGEIWTDSIQIGANDHIENWHDTNDNPPGPEEEVTDAEAVEILMGGAAP